MSVDQMTSLFAFLTVVAALVAIAAASASLFGRKNERVQQFRRDYGTTILLAATLIPLTCMLGSLYYSEIENFTPCRYCWFQRIFMYSTAIILIVAWIRRDLAIKPYALTLATIGGMIGLYHVLLERNVIVESSACDPNNPCTLDWLDHKWNGWITIPSMAFVGFCATVALLTLVPRQRADDIEHIEMEMEEV